MILRQVYGVDVPAGAPALDLPLVVPIAGGTATMTVGERDGTLRLTLDRRVDRDLLTLRTQTGTKWRGEDGVYVEIPMVEVGEGAVEELVGADDIAAALSFLTDLPFRVFRPGPGSDELLPETGEDEALLGSLGTREV